MPAEMEELKGQLARMDERLTERRDKQLCSRRSHMRMQVIKWVHSIFRLELCLLTHTEAQRRRRQREKNCLSHSNSCNCVSASGQQPKGGGGGS